MHQCHVTERDISENIKKTWITPANGLNQEIESQGSLSTFIYNIPARLFCSILRNLGCYSQITVNNDSPYMAIAPETNATTQARETDKALKSIPLPTTRDTGMRTGMKRTRKTCISCSIFTAMAKCYLNSHSFPHPPQVRLRKCTNVTDTIIRNWNTADRPKHSVLLGFRAIDTHVLVCHGVTCARDSGASCMRKFGHTQGVLKAKTESHSGVQNS